MTTWLNVKNNAESALASAITAAATTLTLVSGDGAKFPSTNFNITIDDEILTCSSRTGDVLTVTRAQETTTAAIHAAGAIVALNVTAAVIQQLQTGVDAAAASGGREMLTANRTYYVRTDGNDSNTGLVNSAAGAFLTIQKAIDAAAALDCSIYNITIQLGAGTYVVTSIINLKSIIGSGTVTIIGDESTPGNVIIDGQGIVSLFSAVAVSYTTYKLKGFKLYSSTSNCTFGIRSSKGSNVEFQNLDFGTGINQQLRADDGGAISCTGSYSISGGADNHVAGVGGLIRIQAFTITINGTPAFSTAFVTLSYLTMAIMNGITFVGSATGKRYEVTMNGICLCGGSANYFPGNSAGSTSTGGQYA